jgi:NAD-dependent DNA ligase
VNRIYGRLGFNLSLVTPELVDKLIMAGEIQHPIGLHEPIVKEYILKEIEEGEQIIKQLDNVKKLALGKIIHSLGINSFTRVVVTRLVSRMGDIRDLTDAVKDEQEVELLSYTLWLSKNEEWFEKTHELIFT